MSHIETAFSPKTLADCASDPSVAQIIEQYVIGKSKRPLLLYGEPGSGKSKLAMLLPYAICPALQPPEVIWIDAGLHRGVDKIRSIETQVAMVAFNEMNFRAVVLDEVDQLSSDAMLALKNLLTRYIDVTDAHVQFILTTNHVARIDPAVRDRCEEMYLAQPEIAQLLPFAQKILSDENCPIEMSFIERVLRAKSTGRISYREFYRRMERLIG